MGSPILFAVLPASQTPDYEKSITSLEEAFRVSTVPEILLSIAAICDQWPGHCKGSVDAYLRFFSACAECADLPRCRA